MTSTVPERAGQAGLQERLAAAGEAQAHAAAVSATVSLPTRSSARMAGHVERVLEGPPDEHRAAVQLVGVARRPVLAAIELGRDVEEQAARASGACDSKAAA